MGKIVVHLAVHPVEKFSMNTTKPSNTSVAEDPKLPDTAEVKNDLSVSVNKKPPLQGLEAAAAVALTRGTGKFIGGSLKINVVGERQVELVQEALHGNVVSHGVFTL